MKTRPPIKASAAIFEGRELYSRADIMRRDTITLPIQVLAVLTAFDLCDYKRFKFPACFGRQLSILAVITSRSSFETAAILIVGGIAAQSPDHNGCAWGQRSIRFKINPKPAAVSSHSSMLLVLVKK
jgi:hypothetical protein